MGDGSKQNEGIHLSVYAFSTSDVELLITALTKRYNLECSLHLTDRGPRIYINKKNMDILRPLVSNHIVPSMKYKIGL
jgi:AAA+ superfamily predicted ATPase